MRQGCPCHRIQEKKAALTRQIGEMKAGSMEVEAKPKPKPTTKPAKPGVASEMLAA